jgi:hypothetical protein
MILITSHSVSEIRGIRVIFGAYICNPQKDYIGNRITSTEFLEIFLGDGLQRRSVRAPQASGIRSVAPKKISGALTSRRYKVSVS